MQVQYLLPSPQLSQFVNGILVIHHEGAPEFILPLFANGSPAIVLQTAVAKTVVGWRLFANANKVSPVCLEGYDSRCYQLELGPWSEQYFYSELRIMNM
jgi:hypothetical protein